MRCQWRPALCLSNKDQGPHRPDLVLHKILDLIGRERGGPVGINDHDGPIADVDSFVRLDSHVPDADKTRESAAKVLWEVFVLTEHNDMNARYHSLYLRLRPSILARAHMLSPTSIKRSKKRS
ncbi:MAG: hypothetical protein NTW00_16910 [Hyphomicrobiales bacterium]|nr:hypothetical protein [Hyphomicrobiales bacterium]